MVSLADGRIVVGRIEGLKGFRVKAQDYAADEFIGEPAGSYIGGSYPVVYLAPGDYHRVHARWMETFDTCAATQGIAIP